jgi:glucosamine-6-phosphate deaminase
MQPVAHSSFPDYYRTRNVALAMPGAIIPPSILIQGGNVRIQVHADKPALGKAAAEEGAAAMRSAIAANGQCTVVLATGSSQFEMLETLTSSDIDWSRVTAFHLDEYVGLSADHPASFRRYLRERVLDRVPAMGEFVMVEGDAPDLAAEVARLNRKLSGRAVDVCFAGIGENCHLAFNDPPADFEVRDPYIVVELDDACRRQQHGEGWFERMEDVPSKAISMSIRQIMSSRKLIVSVADERKKAAVDHAVNGPVSPDYPASIIQEHADASLHVDTVAAGTIRSGEV